MQNNETESQQRARTVLQTMEAYPAVFYDFLYLVGRTHYKIAEAWSFPPSDMARLRSPHGRVRHCEGGAPLAWAGPTEKVSDKPYYWVFFDEQEPGRESLRGEALTLQEAMDEVDQVLRNYNIFLC